ncbi:M23 family metallopeptidase [Paenibacillus albiflavus]|uniref:M23 family metallopeptidase n=1 Tax=Paenibacillus albiflavus TaxID=2545760 RepID=A0A4R4E920_9BACL|nr:M23 family metallopeptidase [Paenibacillus albiflavus]TCZ76059.1 M23 family metallopeptidase [Paenibacillus albiflavus]
MNPFEGYRITSPYGNRPDPFGGGGIEFHKGIDLVKSHKAPILAFVAGEVIHAMVGLTGSGFGNYGIVVAIKDKRNCLHVYAHLDSASVAVGQQVVAGQEIGKQGTTGQSTGSHLHYEVRQLYQPSYGFGTHTDPTKYLVDYITREETIMFEKLEARIATLEEQTKKVPAPAWFVKEFGSADLGGLINDPTGTEEFWRGLALTMRAAKAGKLA